MYFCYCKASDNISCEIVRVSDKITDFYRYKKISMDFFSKLDIIKTWIPS